MDIIIIILFKKLLIFLKFEDIIIIFYNYLNKYRNYLRNYNSNKGSPGKGWLIFSLFLKLFKL